MKPSPRKPVYSLARAIAGDVPPDVSGSRRLGLHDSLRGLLTIIERHYGRPVTISSGCRSEARNRKVGGAPQSFHLRCMAADIKVAGIGKGQLQRFVKNLPGRGGVGTYCRNNIVHVDVGPQRNWHRACR